MPAHGRHLGGGPGRVLLFSLTGLPGVRVLLTNSQPGVELAWLRGGGDWLVSGHPGQLRPGLHLVTPPSMALKGPPHSRQLLPPAGCLPTPQTSHILPPCCSLRFHHCQRTTGLPPLLSPPAPPHPSASARKKVKSMHKLESDRWALGQLLQSSNQGRPPWGGDIP